MSTITPTSDQKQTFNRTVFQIGDTIRAVSGPDAGKIGIIVTSDGFIPTTVDNPSPPPDFIIEYRPVPLPPLPLATRADPITQNVKVNWSDGTSSVVALSTLGKV